MEAGEGRASAWFTLPLLMALLLGLGTGCATVKPPLDRAIMADRGITVRSEVVADAYTVCCPDILELVVDARPDLTGVRAIGPDGRIDLGSKGRLRIEGLTLPQVARRIAEAGEVPPMWVHVRVVEFKSQQVYVIGQVVGSQRAVAYQGPETVVDLLHRIGGITPGAEPDDVQVVRSRVAEGQSPEVFRVDLRAILLRKDQRSNIYLQPFDQIFVGESRTFSFERCVPPWLRPFYEGICGIRHPQEGQIARQATEKRATESIALSRAN